MTTGLNFFILLHLFCRLEIVSFVKCVLPRFFIAFIIYSSPMLIFFSFFHFLNFCFFKLLHLICGIRVGHFCCLFFFSSSYPLLVFSHYRNDCSWFYHLHSIHTQQAYGPGVRYLLKVSSCSHTLLMCACISVYAECLCLGLFENVLLTISKGMLIPSCLSVCLFLCGGKPIV